VTVKTCRICKASKPEADFYGDRTRRDGLQTKCKTCTKETNSTRYLVHGAKSTYKKSGNKARYARYRAEYLARRTVELQTVRGRLYGVFAVARDRSAKLKREFTITLDWLMVRWADIGGCCEVSGLPLTLERNPPGKRFFNPLNPSIDRRDNSKGYTPANVRIVAVIVNLALNGFGDEVFVRMCKAVAARNSVVPPLP
jgi:hypothetical protein